jgi:hypothetical protein
LFGVPVEEEVGYSKSKVVHHGVLAENLNAAKRVGENISQRAIRSRVGNPITAPKVAQERKQIGNEGSSIIPNEMIANT